MGSGHPVLAGLTLGQDISDRTVQLTGAPPQFSLGKSFPAYGPIGPALVSVDSFADPDDVAEGKDYIANLNPKSLEVVTSARLEPSLGAAKVGDRFQFEWLGYFCVDRDAAPGKPVFNRSVTLRDTWAKMQKKK